MSEGLHFKASRYGDCPRPGSVTDVQSILDTKCCQNLYLVSEPVGSGILNNSSYALQSPGVQFSSSLSKIRGSLSKMKTRCEIVWQESQHGFI